MDRQANRQISFLKPTAYGGPQLQMKKKTYYKSSHIYHKDFPIRKLIMYNGLYNA